jgi:L-aspartate oxidase
MWKNVGIFREIKLLEDAATKIEYWKRYLLTRKFDSPSGYELQNKVYVADIIVKAALKRKESRGAHYLKEYPELNSSLENVHYEFAL